MKLPELIVFDLDFTIWDCGGTWCDCLCPPFTRKEGKVTDNAGRAVRMYQDIPEVLDFCDSKSIPMAVASRTEQPAWARELLGLLEIRDRFAFAEIYPSSKRKHFRALGEASGIPYENMLFFDDELRNINECSTLGVTCIHVPRGFERSLFDLGMRTISL